MPRRREEEEEEDEQTEQEEEEGGEYEQEELVNSDKEGDDEGQQAEENEDEDMLEEDEGEHTEDDDDDDEEEDSSSASKHKRKRSMFIDDIAEEDEDEDDDEEDVNPRNKKARGASAFIDDTAVDASDQEEEEEDGAEEGFIDADGDLDGEEAGLHARSRFQEEDDDVDDLERRVLERYAGRSDEYEFEDQESGDVEQQALLPSVRDPKLWIVKCAIGREREAAACLLQKYLDKQAEEEKLNTTSVIALDHLKGYLYIEANKEAHVKAACKGLRIVYSQTIKVVPIKEMTDVIAVQSKAVQLGKDAWVRVKSGRYKGDLGKVVDTDNIRQRVTVKLVPRLDLKAMVTKMEGTSKDKKKPSVIPNARFVNMREIKDLGISVERKRDPVTGEMFETVDNMMFRDGYLYKTMSLKSVISNVLNPSLDELQKFQRQEDEMDGDVFSVLTANRKKGHFLKGDLVTVVSGDLKNLMGSVERVDNDDVLVRPHMQGIEVLTFNQSQICKLFKPGDHVRVVEGNHRGGTGTVVKVEGNVLVVISDRANEDMRVFADHAVRCEEAASGPTALGGYELHDLVELDRASFGVIVGVESDGFRVLRAVPERADVAGVSVRDVRRKVFDRRFKARDQNGNVVQVRDMVRVVDGPFKGRQGPVEHMNRGLLFVRDAQCPENSGFICARAESCAVIGGARQPAAFRPPAGPPAGRGRGRGRGGRGRGDGLIGRIVKIRLGQYKGYRGRVVGVQGATVRIELESQMRVVHLNRDHLTDAFATRIFETGGGRETPLHPSATPMPPYMTPSDPSATPMMVMDDGMRTPMVDRAWNPNEVMMTPGREEWQGRSRNGQGSPPPWRGSQPWNSRDRRHSRHR